MEAESVASESESEGSEVHSQQDRHQSSTRVPKKKKRRSSKPRHEDSDSEHSRTPLGETFYQNKQSQRANQHPSMPNTRKQQMAKKAAKASRKRDERQDDLEDSEDESESQVPEQVRKRQKKAAEQARIKNLELELLRYKEREKSTAKVASQQGRKKKIVVPGTSSALENLVVSTTKTTLFKVAKFVSNDEQVTKATRKVMESLDIDELRGLEGAELVAAEEEWIATWKDTVRTTLNSWRNYTAGELQKLFKEEWRPGNETCVPDSVQLGKVIMREGLEKKDGMTPQELMDVELNQKHFDFYWDRMVSRVAGHKCWGAGKRHHGLMSTMRESPDSELFVTPSDEAFVLLVWENNFKRWKWQHEQDELEKERKEEAAAQQKENGDKSGADGSKKVSDGEDEDGKGDDSETDDKTDEEGGTKKRKGKGKKKKGKKKGSEGKEDEEKPHPDSVAPYTITDGGAMPYGGWNKLGRKRYRTLLKKITDSKNKKRVKDADTAALLRIRELHQVDERAARAKKGKRAEEVEEIDSEHEPDWF